jgi:hypothetical protein
MGRKGDRRLRQFVNDLVAVSVSELRGAGMNEPEAIEVSQQIANRICTQYARTELYVPAVVELLLGPRDQRIWEQYCQSSPTARAYTEARLAELAAEHQLTVRHLYNIVALMRRRDQAARQFSLPGLAAD